MQHLVGIVGLLHVPHILSRCILHLEPSQDIHRQGMEQRQSRYQHMTNLYKSLGRSLVIRHTILEHGRGRRLGGPGEILTIHCEEVPHSYEGCQGDPCCHIQQFYAFLPVVDVEPDLVDILLQDEIEIEHDLDHEKHEWEKSNDLS